ncbi:uncharacterized protein EV422DRAFT_517767 [Fimicolochytrium jonesii]|uniref:uncharacterized protein n=1 Tax=Fimicolochytrium jonesii TaxID=1396493 RepID=UPI0022FECE1F|nr:uncharacterized protein EV422DRAFT_517767 [Fimicolochytrium jonesii]KAI8825178.1 hypothetical protein EV422DRAFT_517767 [Fimicolochytrium jonesii]
MCPPPEAATAPPPPAPTAPAVAQHGGVESSREQLPSSQSKCSHCGLQIDGQFVRALNGHYHLDCFRCQDCDQVVAEKFFPLTGADGQRQFFCEKDYFRRLDLLCAKCGGALRGAHIDALGKKYHLEHFTCSVCPTVFRQHDSYYEQEGNVYCQTHYSYLFAVKCGGCKTAVLKSFVETNKGTWTEKWHPECYMIYKLWNVTVNPSTEPTPKLPGPNDKADLEANQAIADKAGRILHVLSAFEELSAECISDMLIHLSHEKREEGLIQGTHFVSHIAALFSVLDDIEAKLTSLGDTTGLQHSKEPKQLTKKIVHFFSLLSYVQENAETRQEATKEMISLVTSLAHTLKILIRSALTGALKLERDHAVKTAVSDFLDRLASSSQTPFTTAPQHVLDDCGPDPNPDLCASCNQPIEEECFRLKFDRWHVPCFRCAVCDVDLRGAFRGAAVDGSSRKVVCELHAKGRERPEVGFERVTQLDQYIFLLRCALKRLCALMDIQLESLGKNPNRTSRLSSDEDTPADEANTRDSVPSSDIRRTTSSRGSSRDRISKSDDESLAGPGVPIPSKSQSSAAAAFSHSPLSASTPLDTTSTLTQTPITHAPSLAPKQKKKHPIAPRDPATDLPSLLDLSGLDHWAVRQLAAQALHPLVADQFTLGELMDVACSRKQSVWGRMVDAIRKPGRSKEGTFGVPLEALVEKYGVDTELGPRPGQLHIPILVDSCIRALHTMDLSVEGIFRKNGNIRNLKTISDEIDRDPRTIDLTGNHAVQVAALLKKFLRDMPEPLLTWKLHKLFIATQKMAIPARRKEALHYVCCMLPKPNLDVLSVLAYFLREVAELCEVEAPLSQGVSQSSQQTPSSQHHPESNTDTDVPPHTDTTTTTTITPTSTVVVGGNKMGLDNLATVITPNLLYSKSKNAVDDENILAVEAFRMILVFQDELWLVSL